MADEERRQIEFLIACELDKPSVYMGGPTKASQHKARAIMDIFDRVRDARGDDLREIARAMLEAAHYAPDAHARLERATQALREGLDE